jgi:hypothetical protein
VGYVQLVPNSPYLWALSIGDTSAADNNTVSSIYAYTANANSGLLIANAGNPFFTLNGTSATPAACNGIGGPGSTIAVTFSPSGTVGYALLGGSPTHNNGTYAFAISSGVPQSLGQVPNDCYAPTVVDPSGQFAYYSKFWGSNSDPGYSLVANEVDPTTAALTAVSPPTDVVEVDPVPAAVDPFGRGVLSFYSYQNVGNKSIVGYGIDPYTGDFSAGWWFTEAVAAPTAPISMLISPDGRFAYITASGGLYTYSIDDTGMVNLVGSPVALQIAAGQTPATGVTTATQLDPSGQFLYASASAGSGQQGIYGYTRDALTGALTLIPGSPFAVTSQTVPLQLAIY